MATITVEREELQQIIQNLPDEKISAVLLLIRDFCDEEHIPNEETATALRESADMRNLIGPFHNMEDFMTSLLSEEEDA